MNICFNDSKIPSEIESEAGMAEVLEVVKKTYFFFIIIVF